MKIPPCRILRSSTTAAAVLLGAVGLVGVTLPAHADDTAPASVEGSNDPALHDFFLMTGVNRLAVLEAAKMALEQSSTPEVRIYTQGLIGEETLLLERLRALAGQLDISLPETPSDKLAEKLGKLREKSPDDFDKAFLGLLTAIYERDLQTFEFASKLENFGVREFAVQYRSMFERQLTEIKKLQKLEA